MRKVIFTGPESSGKTTMAKWYSAEIGGVYVPEFARSYLESLDRSYTVEDLKLIAKGQLELMKSATQSGLQPICDTGMLVIKIWAKLKFDFEMDSVNKSIENNPNDLYILCTPDIPWEPDPLREDEHNRRFLFEYYIKTLNELNLSYIVLKGDMENRKKILSALKLPE